MSKETHNSYIIPDNFIEGGRILNGMFKTRNFLEAIGISAVLAFPLWNIHYPSFTVKITVVLSVILPFFLIAVMGINDSSFLTFLHQLYKWKKGQRMMLYNNHLHSRSVRPMEVGMAQEMPKDKLVSTIEKWKEKRQNKNKNISYIEGEDFEFNEDEEYSSGFLNTEKKLLGLDNLDMQKSKKKRKKNTLLLSEQNTILPEQTTVSAESEPIEISVDDIEFSEAAVADEENDDCTINDEIIINSDEITVLDETEVI